MKPLKLTDAAGQETRYDYDSVGNLIGVDYSDATPDVRFTYNSRHELSTMIDGLGTTSFKHMAAGQRTRMSVVGWVQDYHYDGAQRLDRIQAPSGTFRYDYPTGSGTLPRASRQWERLALPGGHEIRQTHDTLARLTKTTLRNGSGQALNRHGYRFNARHQKDRRTFLAGNTIDYDYSIGRWLTAHRNCQRLESNFGAQGELQTRESDEPKIRESPLSAMSKRGAPQEILRRSECICQASLDSLESLESGKLFLVRPPMPLVLNPDHLATRLVAHLGDDLTANLDSGNSTVCCFPCSAGDQTRALALVDLVLEIEDALPRFFLAGQPSAGQIFVPDAETPPDSADLPDRARADQND